MQASNKQARQVNSRVVTISGPEGGSTLIKISILVGQVGRKQL